MSTPNVGQPSTRPASLPSSGVTASHSHRPSTVAPPDAHNPELSHSRHAHRHSLSSRKPGSTTRAAEGPSRHAQHRLAEKESERKERKRREYEKQQAAMARKAVTNQIVPENRLKRPTTFICRTRFLNGMPALAGAKWLELSTDEDSLSEYNLTKLEWSRTHKLHVEPDLGIPLDLLDMTKYNGPSLGEIPVLDPEDVELLKEEVTRGRLPGVQDTRSRNNTSHEQYSWLVKTQYIAPAEKEVSRKAPKKEIESAETKKEALLGWDRGATVASVEETFLAAKSLPAHPTNPKLRPLRVLPILPELDRFGDQYLQLMFDAGPLEGSKKHNRVPKDIKDEMEARAVMKSFRMGATDDMPEQSFVAYMVPAVPHDEMIPEPELGETMSYDWLREYHWTVRPNDPTKPSFVFSIEDDAVKFVPMSARLAVQKLKAQGKHRSSSDPTGHRAEFPIPKQITIRKREFNDLEESKRDMNKRMYLEGKEAAGAVE